MGWRSACFLLALAILGCQVVLPPDPNPDRGSARLLWQKGQEAMRLGQTDAAIDCYNQSLSEDPDFVRNHLSLAAAYLEQGCDELACPHLARYVHSGNAEVLVQVHLADLLLRLGRLDEARCEFEQCVVGTQEAGEQDKLLHCHAKLMEIGERTEDFYGEHLNRGIGLFLLAREQSTLPEADSTLPIEGLLCKAAGELTLAVEDRPDEARPRFYLHGVWSLLGQRSLARRSLEQAAAASPFTFLTPSEQQQLALALQLRAEPSVKRTAVPSRN